MGSVSMQQEGRRADRRSRVRTPDGRNRLFFASRRLPPLADLFLRVVIAVALIIAVAAIVYVERGCYTDRGVDGELTFIDALYYSTVSLSTTGYGDITPICQSSRLVNILVITPMRFLFLIILIGTTVQVLTQRTREEFRSNRWRKHVNGHTIIVGYGVKGRSAAKALVDAGIAKNDIVVVSEDRASVDEATRAGHIGVLGDARREEILRDAAIERCHQVIVATDEDDTTVLITLTVRRLSPDARIVVAARETINADILRQSGANAVIPTAESAGRLMGLSLVSPTAGDLMEDLLDAGRGLDIAERPITREELGLSPSRIDADGQLVLAVVRGTTVHRFDEPNMPTVLQQGDRVVVIRHTGTPHVPHHTP